MRMQKRRTWFCDRRKYQEATHTPRGLEVSGYRETKIKSGFPISATSVPLGVFKRTGVRAGGKPGKITERERDEKRPPLSPILPVALYH